MNPNKREQTKKCNASYCVKMVQETQAIPQTIARSDGTEVWNVSSSVY